MFFVLRNVADLEVISYRIMVTLRENISKLYQPVSLNLAVMLVIVGLVN